MIEAVGTIDKGDEIFTHYGDNYLDNDDQFVPCACKLPFNECVGFIGGRSIRKLAKAIRDSSRQKQTDDGHNLAALSLEVARLNEENRRLLRAQHGQDANNIRSAKKQWLLQAEGERSRPFWLFIKNIIKSADPSKLGLDPFVFPEDDDIILGSKAFILMSGMQSTVTCPAGCHKVTTKNLLRHMSRSHSKACLVTAALRGKKVSRNVAKHLNRTRLCNDEVEGSSDDDQETDKE